MNNTDARITLRVGKHGFIRLLLRPEWSPGGAEYARLVAAAAQPTSQVYRLEPGFLIQGRLAAPGVPAPRDNTRAPKLMERGEVGWAGGSAGPDYFIYLGLGPATWLGNPHEGTIFAEVADEESMQVASNVSLLPVPLTAPGQMHLLKVPVPVTASLGHVTHDEHEIEEGRAATPWAAAADVEARLTKAELEARRVVQTSRFEAEPLSSLASVADGVPTLGVLKVVGAVIDASAAACAPSCHALPHTELHGDVVKWGESHVLTSAAACCAACEEHAAAYGGAVATTVTSGNTGNKPCNVWVWCSNAERCGKRHGQCWLKHAKQLWADQAFTVGTSEAWTAGTVQAAPADHPSGAGRFTPSAADADLALDFALAISELQPSEPIVVKSAAKGVVAGDAAAATMFKRAGNGTWMRTVRLKIRDAAPRSAARLRALAHAAAAPEAAREWAAALMDAAAGVAAVACAAEGHQEGHSPFDLHPDHSDPPTASPLGVLTGGQPVPKHWGQATLLDGFGVHARWPRGAAILHGILGAGWAGTGIRNGSFRMRVPVEAHPVPVLRGSVCWSTLGADGPDFFIALADHPQLGVAHTIVGEVVREDIMLLDQLADDVARGRLRLPARVRVRSL